MNITDTYYEVQYRVRGESVLHVLREDDIKQAYSMRGSIKHLCTHVAIIKHILYQPSFIVA